MLVDPCGDIPKAHPKRTQGDLWISIATLDWARCSGSNRNKQLKIIKVPYRCVSICSHMRLKSTKYDHSNHSTCCPFPFSFWTMPYPTETKLWGLRDQQLMTSLSGSHGPQQLQAGHTPDESRVMYLTNRYLNRNGPSLCGLIELPIWPIPIVVELSLPFADHLKRILKEARTRNRSVQVVSPASL